VNKTTMNCLLVLSFEVSIVTIVPIVAFLAATLCTLLSEYRLYCVAIPLRYFHVVVQFLLAAMNNRHYSVDHSYFFSHNLLITSENVVNKGDSS
jgi:hypothetical protein